MNVKIKKHDLLVIECAAYTRTSPLAHEQLRSLVISEVRTGVLCLPPGYKATLYQNVYINDVTISEVIKMDNER